MRRNLIALILATLPTAVLAHHGWSSYDSNKPIKLTAAVRAVSWGNPHGTAKVTHDGKTWDVVLAPVSRMEARGLEKDALSTAKAVTLEGYPRSDGTAEMRIERVTLNGKTIELR